MSVFIFQFIVQQWDKSQQEQQFVEARSQLAKTKVLGRDSSFYVVDEQCIIDVQGDDIVKKRITFKQLEPNRIQLDRFQLDLNNKLLRYVGAGDQASPSQVLAQLDNGFIQCHYQWRYRVFEGGFYYWLYEQVTVNVIGVDTVQEDVFIQCEPHYVFDNLA